MTYRAVSPADLAAGDGPHLEDAERFLRAGSCDQCGSTLDGLEGDDLCSRCRLLHLLSDYVYSPMS